MKRPPREWMLAMIARDGMTFVPTETKLHEDVDGGPSSVELIRHDDEAARISFNVEAYGWTLAELYGANDHIDDPTAA